MLVHGLFTAILRHLLVNVALIVRVTGFYEKRDKRPSRNTSIGIDASLSDRNP